MAASTAAAAGSWLAPALEPAAARPPEIPLGSRPLKKPWRVFAIDNALTPSECAQVVSAAEAHGFEAAGVDLRVSRSTADSGHAAAMRPDVRLNERIVLHDPELSAMLFARLSGVLPPTFRQMELDSFSPCVRLYKYGPGNFL